MTSGTSSAVDFDKAKRRAEFMEQAAASRGIQATRIEPQPDGGIDNFVEDVSPYLELYWSLENGEDEETAAELCLWFLDNPDHEPSHCFFVRYAAECDAWEFGYQHEPDAKHESPKAKRLALEAFGFETPGTRPVSEPTAMAIINALCAGFATTLPKDNKNI